jgi:gamma-glutamylcyclotransferase (GGCT)/AIG2-like uncharacterized protein YtfP
MGEPADIGLFAYGTLRDAPIQQSVFGRRLNGDPDGLAGWRRGQVIIEGQAYPMAEPDPASELDGRLYQLTQDDLVRADAYEGETYRRIRVTLTSGRQAWFYVAAEPA